MNDELQQNVTFSSQVDKSGIGSLTGILRMQQMLWEFE